ncbi:DNA translocase FtsK [Bacillus sp. J33]|uniref:DNA translocase FtsK n=1 Tax=Bacillus sp. J33 TaxID=935836 RepID=UPI00054D7DFD|nr:DNA translocase FtsK [Bacillus sp. J33]
MSWIKKLFHMFRNDEDEYEYENLEEYTEEREYENIQPQSKNTKESSRDVDAKVLYQYPKGQFRFPVIPDHEGEQESKRPRPRPRPAEKRDQQARKPEKRQPRTAERERQRKPAAPAPAPAKKEDRVLTRNEREAANKKRPFQPTEIPSPIYGFERPRPGSSKNKSDNEASENKPKELTYDEVMRKIQQMPSQRPKTVENIERKAAQEDTISDKLEAFHAQAAALETVESETKKYTIGGASDLMFEVPEEDSESNQHSEFNKSNEADEREDQDEQVNDEMENLKIAPENKKAANISDLLEYALKEEASIVQESKKEITEEVSKPAAEKHNEPLVPENEVNAPEADVHLEQDNTDIPDQSFENEVQSRSAESGNDQESNSFIAEPPQEAGHPEKESEQEAIEHTPELEEMIPNLETSEGLHQESDTSEELPDNPELESRAVQEHELSKEQTVSENILEEQPDPQVNEGAKHKQLEGTKRTADPMFQASPASSEHSVDNANTDKPVAHTETEELSYAEQKQEIVESEIEDSSAEAQPADKEQPEKKSSSRGHIPFNVIMLNNDRKKLNQQKKVEKPAESQIRPGEEHQKKSSIARFPVENMQQSAAAVEKAGDCKDVYTETSSQADSPVQQVAVQNQQSPGTESARDEQPANNHEEEHEISYYEFPSQTLLIPPVIKEETTDWLYEQEQMLNSTLKNFNVRARVVNVTQGPSVTRFEVQPEPGVKVNKITNLSDDIKLSLAARDIRIEAPIPGKHTIGIEVPNQSSKPVFISEIINTPEFQNSESPLTAILGLDISGKPIVTDLRKMPHGLIAGATGSGKSVCINTVLVSLLYKANPDELKLLLIDPKMVELAPYNRIPHLVSPVITDVKAATAALKWAVEEMERRYELFAHAGVRDINRFNELAEEHKRYSEKLPFMVIVIDELADLMMMSPADVEEAICRIAQKARACGIHLIIATQRPSVDVITGLIKANVPTRIAFSVSSQIDSRTIIDISGAEKLLGRGDMLFLENGSSKPVRIQGTFVSDKEIDDVVAHVRRERDPDYLFEQEELLKKAQIVEEEDELFFEACEYVVDQGAASTSSLQRRFKIGYNRAARLIDMMEQQGFISENRGSKPRDVLITEADLESIQDTSTIN